MGSLGSTVMKCGGVGELRLSDRNGILQLPAIGCNRTDPHAID
jgi:hypothetical protein